MERPKQQPTESKKKERCQRREVVQGLREEMSIVTECCVVLRPEGKTQNLISRKKKPPFSLFLSHPLLSISLPHLSPTQLAFGFVLLLSLPPSTPEQEIKSILKSFGKPQGLQTRK